MYCLILEPGLLQIRIEYVSKYFYMNVDATMIMDNSEWILNNDTWESNRRIPYHHTERWDSHEHNGDLSEGNMLPENKRL
jgi:hypothetical protein